MDIGKIEFNPNKQEKVEALPASAKPAKPKHSDIMEILDMRRGEVLDVLEAETGQVVGTAAEINTCTPIALESKYRLAELEHLKKFIGDLPNGGF